MTQTVKVNSLPGLTWNWLRMNKAEFSLGQETKKSGAAFEVSELPKGFSFFAEFNQEETKSGQGIKTGMGKEFTSLLDGELEKSPKTPAALLEIADGAKSDKSVILRLNLSHGGNSLKRLFIKAGKNSQASIVILWSSPKKAAGLNALQTIVDAEKDSKVRLATIQLLGDGFVHANDIGTIQGEGSQVEISQLELGGKKLFQGIHSTQKEKGSAFRHNEAYFLDKDRELDMNFVADQFGQKTESDMKVYGSLKDFAKKTYRGTIDFKKGCQGAVGNEQEEILLLSPDIANKSIPLILCDEEDVQGEHGASVGRLDESLLFYMNSRGVDEKQAQKMMARGKVARVAALIDSQEAAKEALDFFDGAFD